VIVRTSADQISQQSRAATGVRIQRLDSGDRLSEVVLVPPQSEQDLEQEKEQRLEELPSRQIETIKEDSSE